MTSPLVQAIISLVVSVICAAVAGYLGVRFGLSQFIREKAFERRLDWFERTMKDLNAVQFRNMQVIADARLNNNSSLIEDSTELIRLLDELILLLYEAELFASSRALTAAQTLRYELNEKMHPEIGGRYMQLIKAKHLDESQNKEVLKFLVEMCETLKSLYDEPKRELAQDIRTYLRLDPIKKEKPNQTNRGAD